mmetsp:Transcript_11864/g.34159  ORF Transcript_11864/g.34159 Transcript_11864/m.34159 type:complete len:122 (-) Transcript_11864:304-669(-)
MCYANSSSSRNPGALVYCSGGAARVDHFDATRVVQPDCMFHSRVISVRRMKTRWTNHTLFNCLLPRIQTRHHHRLLNESSCFYAVDTFFNFSHKSDTSRSGREVLRPHFTRFLQSWHMRAG